MKLWAIPITLILMISLVSSTIIVSNTVKYIKWDEQFFVNNGGVLNINSKTDFFGVVASHFENNQLIFNLYATGGVGEKIGDRIYLNYSFIDINGVDLTNYTHTMFLERQEHLDVVEIQTTHPDFENILVAFKR